MIWYSFTSMRTISKCSGLTFVLLINWKDFVTLSLIIGFSVSPVKIDRNLFRGDEIGIFLSLKHYLLATKPKIRKKSGKTYI